MVGEAVLPRKVRGKMSQDEIEAAFRRKMNLRIREVQFVMHKIHVLSWIAFGNYANRVLNNLSLMNMALKLLPSKQSYPDGPSCERYFESIVKWFGTKVQLKSRNTYCHLLQIPPLPQSLALQIGGRHAICYRDFVFIFVMLLRAIGLQCRLVMNFQTVPKRPAQSDLMSLTAQEPAKDTKSSTNTKSSKSSATTSKPSTSASTSGRDQNKDAGASKSSSGRPKEESRHSSPNKHSSQSGSVRHSSKPSGASQSSSNDLKPSERKGHPSQDQSPQKVMKKCTVDLKKVCPKYAIFGITFR